MDVNGLAHEVWAMSQGQAPIDDAVQPIMTELHLFAEAVRAAERERLLSELRRMHDEQADRAVWHNYFLFAANVLAGKLLPEGEAPSTTRLVTLDQAEAMVAAERERIRLLVEAVRDANAASQDADDCLIYTPAVERAWVALLVGLDGPTAPGPAL